MRSLDLRRTPSGLWEETWKEDGACRVLNTPPVLRHSVLRSDCSADFVMAWVSVPDLGSPAEYVCRHRSARFGATPRRES
jgi:hypothetical protein